ncbi:hypothetical protein LZ32DRAFT_608737 [Colletotrichum eremochloae]|nr:hypothetical protein LZ32DRAFT_608737 [Colletotrichum eremochloae]
MQARRGTPFLGSSCSATLVTVHETTHANASGSAVGNSLLIRPGGCCCSLQCHCCIRVPRCQGIPPPSLHSCRAIRMKHGLQGAWVRQKQPQAAMGALGQQDNHVE